MRANTKEAPILGLELFDLTGKNALITGSGRGIGLTLARGLAEAGAGVVLNDVDEAVLRERQEELQRDGHSCSAYAFDVTDEAQVSEAIRAIEREAGHIDILINNAGMTRRGALDELAESDWQSVIDLNLTAVWRVSKYVVRGMIQRGHGKIINMASLMSFGSRPGTGAYAASKGGLASLTKAMTVDWAAHNIQINAMAPGYFVTDLNSHLAADPQFDSWVKMRTPAKRWGELDELVGLGVFFASSASDFITGQIVYVDGGWTANL